MPVTRPAPKRFAASARIPLPVPRSTSDQPSFRSRVKRSRMPSDIVVVACSPVPKAAEAGMTSKGIRWACDCAAAVGLNSPDEGFFAGRCVTQSNWRDLLNFLEVLRFDRDDRVLEINSRFPILSGFDLQASANRFNQLRGHFSTCPPNSSISFRESLRDVQATSS